MTATELGEVARGMVADGKGILAADERVVGAIQRSGPRLGGGIAGAE